MVLGMSNDDWKKDPEKKKKLIEKMVRLLQEGHRMLDEICPKCDSILFYRKDVGLRYCPYCDVFLASPEELEKLNRSDIKIIGEYAGGRIIEYKRPQEVPTEALQPRESQPISRTPNTSGEAESLNQLIDRLVRIILEKLQDRLLYELERAPIRDILGLLKVLMELRVRGHDGDH